MDKVIIGTLSLPDSIEKMKKVLEARYGELEKTICVCKERCKKLPKGKLRISINGNSIKYYKRSEPSDKNGKYIKKGQMKIAKQLAEREYYQELQKTAQAEKDAIEKFLIDVSKLDLIKVYDEMSKYKQMLFYPLFETDEMYAERWLKEEYQKADIFQEKCIFQTKKGDLVRSKSEKIIADMLFDNGIPYRYESVIKMENGKTFVPDFTVLNVKRRKVVYWEHFGMLDDPSYSKGFIEKISSYGENGILLGNDLFATFESNYVALDIKTVERVIKQIIS